MNHAEAEVSFGTFTLEVETLLVLQAVALEVSSENPWHTVRPTGIIVILSPLIVFRLHDQRWVRATNHLM
jgi:hypothetical protein